MEVDEIARTVDKMRVAVDKRLARRRVWSRFAIVLLLAICGGLTVLAVPAIRDSDELAHLRTFGHNVNLDDEDRNRFVDDVATYVDGDDVDTLVVDSWGRIVTYDASGPAELLVVRFHYSIVAPTGQKLTPFGRWARQPPVGRSEGVEWTEGTFFTARGRSRVVTEAPGRSAIAATACTRASRPDADPVRLCAGSVVFELTSGGTDREVIPDDVIIVRTLEDGSRQGVARTVLVDDARRWNPCQLLVCTGRALEPPEI